MLTAGTTPLGGAFTGAMADLWGVRAAVEINAGLCLVGATVGRIIDRRRGRSEPLTGESDGRHSVLPG
jgi:hypothetical protein